MWKPEEMHALWHQNTFFGKEGRLSRDRKNDSRKERRVEPGPPGPEAVPGNNMPVFLPLFMTTGPQWPRIEALLYHGRGIEVQESQTWDEINLDILPLDTRPVHRQALALQAPEYRTEVLRDDEILETAKRQFAARFAGRR